MKLVGAAFPREEVTPSWQFPERVEQSAKKSVIQGIKSVTPCPPCEGSHTHTAMSVPNLSFISKHQTILGPLQPGPWHEVAARPGSPPTTSSGSGVEVIAGCRLRVWEKKKKKNGLKKRNFLTL